MLGILRAAVVSQAVLTGDVDADKEERAMGLLTINVGREYVSVVGHAKTAKEAWEKLKRKCEAHSTVQKLLCGRGTIRCSRRRGRRCRLGGFDWLVLWRSWKMLGNRCGWRRGR